MNGQTNNLLLLKSLPIKLKSEEENKILTKNEKTKMKIEIYFDSDDEVFLFSCKTKIKINSVYTDFVIHEKSVLDVDDIKYDEIIDDVISSSLKKLNLVYSIIQNLDNVDSVEFDDK